MQKVLFSLSLFFFFIGFLLLKYAPGEADASNDPIILARAGIISIVDISKSSKMGEIFRKEMRNFKSPFIEEVRGKGLLNAITIKPNNGKEAWDVCLAMKENGLIAKPTHGNIIRFTPPLTITEEQMMDAISKIKAAFKEFE